MRFARRASRALVAAIASLAAAMALAACAGTGSDASPATQADAGVHVVATTSVLGDVVENVVGEAGTVSVLMRAGTDPHSYEPAASDARQLRDADLVVANGLGLEESLLDIFASLEDEGVDLLRVADDLDPIPFGAASRQVHDEHDHGTDGHAETEGAERGDTDDADAHDADDAERRPLDPHFWLDPVRTADAVTLVGEALARVAPGDADVFETNARVYRDEVLALHEDVRATLAAVPEERRLLVTNHDSLGYLAARYDFTIVGTVLPGGTTLAQASGQTIAELAHVVEEAAIPAIFVETTAPERLADAVSAEVGGIEVQVVMLYTGSLGEEGSDAETYLAMMRENAERIAAALGP